MVPLTQAFDDLQSGLGDVLALNKPGSVEPHVVVVLPSFSLGESLLCHYADRIPSLEHRFLVACLMLCRIQACEMVFVTCEAPTAAVIDYYLALVPDRFRDSVRSRLRTVVVDDLSPRAVAAKLLDRPEVLDRLRDSFDGRPAFVEPWNVTDLEVAVAGRLGVPVNGTAPDLWPLGYKSAGRRLFREAGVPTPFGREDVHSVEEAVEALVAVRRARPDAPGAVIKHDNSGAGDGNVVIDFRDLPDGAAEVDALRTSVQSLPEWYREDLRLGGVVEELVAGALVTSPSVQLDILPGGAVEVLATHEQVLGGETGQVYTGCRFPADPAYAAELARHGGAVGERLAAAGVLGRLSVDFVAADDGAGAWAISALEVNLRKGGTTPPYAVLRNLVPGRYEVDPGRWLAEDGTVRAYRSTDNLVDERWRVLSPSEVIVAVTASGVGFDPVTGTGVVLHMLSGLHIDGRFGLTAIGLTPDHADELHERAKSAVEAVTLAAEVVRAD